MSTLHELIVGIMGRYWWITHQVWLRQIWLEARFWANSLWNTNSNLFSYINARIVLMALDNFHADTSQDTNWIFNRLFCWFAHGWARILTILLRALVNGGHILVHLWGCVSDRICCWIVLLPTGRCPLWPIWLFVCHHGFRVLLVLSCRHQRVVVTVSYQHWSVLILRLFVWIEGAVISVLLHWNACSSQLLHCRQLMHVLVRVDNPHIIHVLIQRRIIVNNLRSSSSPNRISVVLGAKDGSHSCSNILRTAWISRFLDTHIGEVVLWDYLVHLWWQSLQIWWKTRLDGYSGLISRCKCHLPRQDSHGAVDYTQVLDRVGLATIGRVVHVVGGLVCRCCFVTSGISDCIAINAHRITVVTPAFVSVSDLLLSSLCVHIYN